MDYLNLYQAEKSVEEILKDIKDFRDLLEMMVVSFYHIREKHHDLQLQIESLKHLKNE